MPDFFTLNGAPGDSEHVRPESDRGGGSDPMSLATDPATGAVIDEIADRFADADEARMRELNQQIRARRHEHETKLCPCGCLAPLGSCDAGKPRAALKTFTPDPPANVPAEPKEIPMPCSVCGGEGHNARSCSKRKDPKPALPAKPKAAAAPKPRKVLRRGATVDVEELLARRSTLIEDLADVERQIEDAIGEQQEKLDRMREAVAGATKRAAAA
jgi:hypothetical protein